MFGNIEARSDPKICQFKASALCDVAAPPVVFSTYGEKSRCILKAADVYQRWAPWKLMEPIDIPTTDLLRKLSTTYKKRAAVASDGIHMRHCRPMLEDVVQTAAYSSAFIDATGVLPSRVRRAVLNLGQKPNGAYRMRGLFTSIYRLYGRVVQLSIKAWHKEVDERFFSQPANIKVLSISCIVLRYMRKK